MASGDVKLAYAASASLTITLASLASDSNLLAGRESTANTQLYLGPCVNLTGATNTLAGSETAPTTPA